MLTTLKCLVRKRKINKKGKKKPNKKEENFKHKICILVTHSQIPRWTDRQKDRQTVSWSKQRLILKTATNKYKCKLSFSLIVFVFVSVSVTSAKLNCKC